VIINLDDSNFTTTVRNMRVKRSLVFKPMINATNKNNKVFMDVMDYINLVQLDIDQGK
jgi:hypothetical protein